MTDTNRGHLDAENDVTASQVAAVCLIQVQFSHVSPALLAGILTVFSVYIGDTARGESCRDDT